MRKAHLGFCDGCGREMAKAHRVHEGKRFCITCYARDFKRRPCPSCSRLARLPKFDAEAKCRSCIKTQQCIRCHATSYSLGKITPYGPVCNSCSVYFREVENCQNCGKPSQRLRDSSRLGNSLRLCPRCVQSGYQTCPACRRYRLLKQTPDGTWLCKKCSEQGQIPCSSCQASMPAGRGRICEECYWRELVLKRIHINCAIFSSLDAANMFELFGVWLVQRVGSMKAAHTIHRYVQFFISTERRWSPIPAYAELLEQFGAAGLRRAKLPMEWLRKGCVVPDPQLREADSERETHCCDGVNSASGIYCR